MEAKSPKFDAPIPGMSMTHELGARPWQQPPQLKTVEEVIDHYTTKMMSDEFSDKLIDIMDMGIPLTTIANTMQMSGVMEGKHTIDSGLLSLPVLIETMMLIGDSAEIKYTSGLEDAPKKDRETLVHRSMEKYNREKGNSKSLLESEPSQPMTEEAVDLPSEEPKGLMARREA